MPRYRRFGDYILLRKIATGGMAEVHLAIKRGPASFDRLVALKTILQHRNDHEAFISMFFNEARLGARFNHPNLVNVYDVNAIDDTLTMVMEYVPGPNVSDLVRRCTERGVDVGRAFGIRIVLDACLGLYHAHHLRDLDGTPLEVVHRDVSPQNILVGYSGQVKVFDFGIAYSSGGNGESEQLSGVLAGKYAYMSPEQCHGAELDERSDVFSLGTLLWELTTQRRLFRRKNQIAVLRAITEEEIPAPSDFVENYPKGLERVVMAALERDPDKRPQTALQLHDRLLQYAALAQELPSSTSLGRFMEQVYSDEIHSEWASMALALQQIEESEMVDASEPSEPVDEEADTVGEAAIVGEPDAGMALEALAARTVGDSSDELITTGALHSPLEVTLADALQRSRRLSVVLAVVLFLALAGAATTGLLLASGRTAGGSATEVATEIGQLTIDSEPGGATIFVNGVQRAESTPAVIETELGEPVDVRLALEGYNDAQAQVTATAEAPFQNVGLTLMAVVSASEAGTVRVVSTPADAAIRIDGALRGRATPLVVGGLSLGETHLLSVEREGYEPRELSFELVSAATREFRVELQAVVPLGRLTIQTEPAGAQVLIDGEIAGQTPLEALPLVSGREFVVELQLDGYRLARETINLAPEEQRLIEERLRPRRRDTGPEDDGLSETPEAAGTESDEPAEEPEPEPEAGEDESPYELLR